MKKFAFALICSLVVVAQIWMFADDINRSSGTDTSNARPSSVSVPSFAEPDDTLIVGDFDGDGLADDSCWYSPATGKWKIPNYRNQPNTSITWWSPMPDGIDRYKVIDYNKDGLADIACYYEKTGLWLVAVNGLNQFADPIVVDSIDLF